MLRDRVRALPGVQAVAHASRAPLSVNFNRIGVAPAELTEPDAAFVPVEMAVVGAGYFDALGVPVLVGRPLDDVIDTADSPPVAIVNEAFARRFWPDGSAVGRRIRTGSDESTVVGVVRDYRVRFLQEPPTPYVHFAASQRPGMVSAAVLLARTRGDAGTLAVAMQRELRRIDPDVVFWPGLTMRDNVATQLLPVRLLSAMLGTSGVVAVWLAALGLYGVIAHAVVRRTREIGIRMALGATPRDVLGLVVRQGGVLVGAGAAVGVALAFAAARATAGVLFGIDATDPLAWGGAVVTLAVVGGLAHAVPARRAVRVAPAVALRSE